MERVLRTYLTKWLLVKALCHRSLISQNDHKNFLWDKVILMPYLTKWPYLSRLLYDLVQFELLKKSLSFDCPLQLHQCLHVSSYLLWQRRCQCICWKTMIPSSTFSLQGVLEARWMQIALNQCTEWLHGLQCGLLSKNFGVLSHFTLRGPCRFHISQHGIIREICMSTRFRPGH